MSDSASDDVEISRLELAAAFMRAVRQEQATAYTKFVGRNRISDEQKQAITQAIDSSALVAAAKDATHTDLLVNALAERFGEMCRRRGAEMTEGLRRSVVKLLATELWVNHTALGAGPENLLSATVLQGAVAPELLKEFPQLPAYAVAYAMQHSPMAPHHALQRAERDIAEVSSEAEFRLLARNRRSSLVGAALQHPSDVRGELRKVQAALKKEGWAAVEATRQPSNPPKER